eukprot:SAG11_NODE_10753_length_808_cov_0.654443_1_plen_20_part_01
MHQIEVKTYAAVINVLVLLG